MLDRIIEAPRFFTYYNLIFLGQAMLTTFALTAVGCLGGFFFGFLIAAVRQTRRWLAWPLRAVAFLATELFRRVPFLVTLFVFFYSFEVLDLDLSVFWVAMTAVIVVASAFIAEIVRAAFESVHQNQWDAAVAMNFSLPMTLRHVVLPQAWKVILPPAFSFFILFIKETALASQIGVVELTYVGKVLNNRGFSAALAFGSILVLLTGAVDCHVHACPHLNGRSLDVFQAVEEAAAAGMRAIGLMDNFVNSSGLAALANRWQGHLGVEVFGGLIMEPPAGGVSAEAVRTALGYGYGPGDGARFVSLPTHHTRNVARAEGRSPAYVESCLEIPETGPPPDPLPEILDLVAAADVVFNTGHVSGPEAARAVEAARAAGRGRLPHPRALFPF